MSLQTQIILPGHYTIAELASLLQEAGYSVTASRQMRVTDHALLEVEGVGGLAFAIEAFLNSFAAEDYQAAYTGPSTLLSMQYSPASVELAAGLGKHGGCYREHDMLGWGGEARAPI